MKDSSSNNTSFNEHQKANLKRNNPQLRDIIQLKSNSKYKHQPLKKEKCNNANSLPDSHEKLKPLQQCSSTSNLMNTQLQSFNIALTEDMRPHYSESTGNLLIPISKLSQISKRQKDTHALIKTLEIILDAKNNTYEEDEYNKDNRKKMNWFVSFNSNELTIEEKEIITNLKENFTIHDILNIIISQKEIINQAKALEQEQTKTKSELDKDISLHQEELESVCETLIKFNQLNKEKQSLEKKNEYLMTELIKSTYIKKKMYLTINQGITLLKVNNNQLGNNLTET